MIPRWKNPPHPCHGNRLFQNTVCLSHGHGRFTFLKEEKVCFLSEEILLPKQCLERSCWLSMALPLLPCSQKFSSMPLLVTMVFSSLLQLVCLHTTRTQPEMSTLLGFVGRTQGQSHSSAKFLSSRDSLCAYWFVDCCSWPHRLAFHFEIYRLLY